MDDDECPDSTVMIEDDEIYDDDDAINVPFPHRRSFEEPQSNRISSTAMQFPTNFQMPQQLPPLPKLIFRPPTQGGNYPSVSFASQQSGLASRIASSSSTASSRGESLGAPRLSHFPSARSESFPGTRGGVGGGQSQRERGDIPLPRLEPMSRSSELTISRVSSTPPVRANSGRVGIAGAAALNELTRVGNVSISRVVESGGGGALPRMSAAAAAASQAKRIAIPPLKRIGGGVSAAAQQSEVGDTSRKFRRNFLKASPALTAKPTLHQPGVSRMPISVMRASSTDEYFSMGQAASGLQAQDVESDAAVDFTSSHRRAVFQSNKPSTSRKSLLAGSETLTSQQGAQGIKLHISKKPVEVIEVDESGLDRQGNSLLTTLQNKRLSSSAGVPFDMLPAKNKSSLNSDEVSVKPVTLKGPNFKDIKLPSHLIAEEIDDEEAMKEEEIILGNKVMEEMPANTSRGQFMELNEASVLKIIEADEAARRSKRKRQPVLSPNDSPPKVRRKRGGGAAVVSGPVPVASPVVNVEGAGTPPSARGKGGTGRGRGRPRGSTNKAKLEREMLQKAIQEQELRNQEEAEPKSKEVDDTSEVKIDLEDNTEKEATPSTATPPVTPITSPVVHTTSPDIETTPPPKTTLPLEGDPEVNAEVTSATPPGKSPRGRGRGTPRGTGTPRSSRARGTRGTKSPRGERKSPEGKKAKQEREKKEKEATLAPPPVQVFEEETRMSATTDIKPPLPDRLNALSTPIPIDEESRASNVSSTSTSTTAKAKRFTKDPIEERKPVTAETLYEYQWPMNDKNAEFYFLQEQISEYLGVKSFKRKYPDIRRRVVDMEERDFLRDTKVVSETQCDLGLTAVHSCDILDIMFNDYPDKYEEYRKVFQERKDQEMAKLKPQNGAVETQAVRDRSAEFMRRILKSCAKWNLSNNKERAEERRCAYDLQTGTLHYPKDKLVVLPKECTQMGNYPVAVLPGQFTDNYKTYTPDELNYLPLNTVRYGPIHENWIVESGSSDDSSDSDDSSSSNDSSSSSSDDEAGSIADNDQNYITLLDESGNVMYRGLTGQTKVSTDAKCRTCEGNGFKNKDGNNEVLLHCSRCDVSNHPTCLELTIDMLPFITKYHWECTDCKNCIECNDPADEDKMLFCDCCDRGYHIYCVGLRKVPTGRWHCKVCAVCYSCGVTQPHPEDRMAEWHHEFRKGEKGAKFYLHSVCVACHKLFKKGQFCPSCLKVHSKLDNKDLLECRKCEKWVHRGCVKRPLKSMFGFMCDPCDANFRSRSKLPSHVN